MIPKLKASKSLGQNFIIDPVIAERVVSHAGEIAGYNVIEIGPGLGAITKIILDKDVKSLIAIEKDEKLSHLHKEELEKKYPHYKFIQQDALEVQIEELSVPPSKVVANLPFNISVILLLKLLRYIHRFEGLTLIFQKEVADRIVAHPGTKGYSILSVLVQLLCDVEKVEDLQPSVFYPVPKVCASILNILPLKSPRFQVDYSYMTKVLKQIFGHRRKTVRNSLKCSTQDFDAILEMCNMSALARPENLSIEQLCIISNFLQSRKYKFA
ncbi:MAG: 16S rRNA (adenine(1518)-N(6)/adenine(1519)-N(6))-dimethyltransferase RsmA [Anaplasma sp.]